VLPACRTIDPPLVEVLPGQRVACIRREPGAEPAPLTPTR
jgi:hypothetical protein